MNNTKITTTEMNIYSTSFMSTVKKGFNDVEITFPGYDGNEDITMDFDTDDIQQMIDFLQSHQDRVANINNKG